MSGGTRIPIGTRIEEVRIALDLDKAKLFRASGIDRKKIREIERGQRDPSEEDLERFAEAFGITVMRLKQEDTEELVEKLDRILSKGIGSYEALELAGDFFSMAIGVSEIVDAYSYLARAHALKNHHSAAQSNFESALRWAKQSKLMDRLVKAYANSVIFHFEIKDYDSTEKLIEEIENRGIFQKDKLHQGEMLYYKSLIERYKYNNLRNAIENARRALSILTDTQDVLMTGRILVNLAIWEMRDSNYDIAQTFFEQARDRILTDNRLVQIRYYKQYGRLYRLMEKNSEALAQVEEGLKLFEGWEHAKLAWVEMGKLLLNKAEILNDEAIALEVLQIPTITKELRFSVAKFLTHHYLASHKNEDALYYLCMLTDSSHSDGAIDWKRSDWY